MQNIVINSLQNYTIEDYGEELYYKETSMQDVSQDHFTLNKKRGNYETYQTKQTIIRVINRISAGLKHFLTLMPNGKLYSTGYFENSNLGRLSTSTDSKLIFNAPVEGLDGLTIIQFESNQYSNLVLTNKGVYSFGYNSDRKSV